MASTQPAIGAIICAVGMWSFVRHFDGRETILGKLIPKKPSQNVVGEISATQKKNVVYLMAHYDTARASLLFHPAMVKNFRQSFLMSATVIFISPMLAFLGVWFGEAGWYKIGTVILGIYVSINIVILLHREFFHKYVNGANDNGSGVTTILTMAKYFAENPPTNTTVKIIATGCEEVGMHGARDFVKRYTDELDLQNTFILNFDNVGAGELHYCIGEGMLGFHHYDPKMVSIADRIAQEKIPHVKPLRYTRAYFDALALVHQDIKTITFIALDKDKTIPHWHWYTDTIDNIEWPAIQKAVDFGIAMVEIIDKS
jgi:hypothetical protein